VLTIAGKHGVNQEIDVFGLLHVWQDEDFGFTKIAPDSPDAMRVRCYNESTNTFTYLRTAAELRKYLQAVRDWFQAKGLLSLVRVTADEPADLEMFKQYLAFVKEAVPEFRYKVYINHMEFIQDPPEGVINAVPMLNLACQNPPLTAHLAETLHVSGGRYAYYIWTQPPRPNTLLHSPLVESQLIGWLTHYLKLDGFERWGFCLWPADPWHRISWRAPIFAAGEMNFVMPGNDGRPVDTLRYEALRAGIQDYELLQLVQRELGPQAQDVINQAFDHILRAKSMAEFAHVATTPAEALYSLDPADYQKAKSILLNALAKRNT
jgi:hypothetical protein